MNTYSLSYVITTFNKLEYLKITLADLINNCKPDEEIVVVDGGSEDGSKEFLELLFKENKIQQFISEPDFGEAHGFNKGFLMAKGDLIKVITDDDAFNFEGIQKCKIKMLANPEIDLMAGNMAYFDLKNRNKIHLKFDDNYFNDWLNNKIPSFWFNGQPLMIRRKQLPLIGFFNPDFIIVDTEFSLRTTFSRKAKLEWCSEIMSVNISNIDSNSVKFKEKVNCQLKELDIIYSERLSEIIKYKENHPVNLFLTSTKNLFKFIFDKVFPFKKLIGKKELKDNNNPLFIDNFLSFNEVFQILKQELIEINKKSNLL
ncbi:MAG: glycosyltransferase [Bacteroidetes bacterium]|nr:glycosyltransferase [Bacteroidota bacterium]